MNANRIKQAVAQAMNIRLSDLNSRSRTRRNAWPRQVAMYLCLIDNDRTIREVAAEFDCHHSNIIHARRKVEYALAIRHKDAIKIKRLQKTICP